MASHYRLGSNTRLLECPQGSEYDEEAFRYLLSLERARAERAQRPIRVLLASFEPTPDQPTAFPRGVAEKVFDGLRRTLRDTDVVGWHAQGRVAAAVMSTTLVSGSDITAFERRIESALRRRLPTHLARTLRLRVVQPEDVELATM